LQVSKELVHDITIVSLVVLIEPKIVKADEEAEEGREFASSRDLVDSLESIIFHEEYHGTRKDLGVVAVCFWNFSRLRDVGSSIICDITGSIICDITDTGNTNGVGVERVVVYTTCTGVIVGTGRTVS
jgi:hypothetical protein